MMRSRFSVSFTSALLFHVFIAIVFFVSLSNSLTTMPSAGERTEVHDTTEIVNAVAISQQELNQEVAAQQAQEAAIKARAAAEARQLAAAKAQALQQIQQAKQQQAALAVKQQADAKKAADELAQLQIQQKQAAQQLAQTQAQAAAAKQAQAAAAKKAADAAEKAAQQQQAQALAAKKAAQQALLAQKAAAASNNVIAQNEINRYVGLITQAVEAQWTQLPGAAQQKLVTRMRITLAKDGTVLQVQTVGSSGNPVLDRLALTAVYKASPLPVPTDPALFAQLMPLTLTFK